MQGPGLVEATGDVPQRHAEIVHGRRDAHVLGAQFGHADGQRPAIELDGPVVLPELLVHVGHDTEHPGLDQRLGAQGLHLEHSSAQEVRGRHLVQPNVGRIAHRE